MEHIPILKMGRVLLVLIQVDMHDRLALALQDALTERIVKERATGVLIVISLLDIVDNGANRNAACRSHYDGRTGPDAQRRLDRTQCRTRSQVAGATCPRPCILRITDVRLDNTVPLWRTCMRERLTHPCRPARMKTSLCYGNGAREPAFNAVQRPRPDKGSHCSQQTGPQCAALRRWRALPGGEGHTQGLE